MIKRKTILIVDNNEINRKILTKILNDEYDIVQACNGREALDFLEDKNLKISAVLLDLVMPVMDGYEFLENLKNMSIISLPIIVTTGNGDKENEKKVFLLGAWDFVTKPYDSQILRYRLQSAIAKSETATIQKLKHLSEHDDLTELHNSKKFFEETAEMLESFPEE